MTGLALGLASLAWLLGAGACVAVYDKPGVTYQEWRRDDAECRQTPPTVEDSGSGAAAYERCMRSRGYPVRDR